MLPVTWVYMSARRTKRHNQSVVETLIMLPIVVAGDHPRSSGTAWRWRSASRASSPRFASGIRCATPAIPSSSSSAIGIGFAAGVQAITVGAVASVIFNLVLLFMWRTTSVETRWCRRRTRSNGRSRFKLLAESNRNGNGNGKGDVAVHDHDIVLALTPQKVDALAERFNRVQADRPDKKKPRYNALLSLTTEEPALSSPWSRRCSDRLAKRWKLDEVVSGEGKPSELAYLVKLRKSMPGDELMTRNPRRSSAAS